MARSSGSDKGKRARYGVMWFCWFCGLQPKFSVNSPEHESQPQPNLAVASASTSASVAASASASASASAPLAACRLMINPNRFRSEVGRGKYGTVFEGYVKSFDEEKEGHIRGLWFGDSLVGPIEKWTKVALKVVNEEGMKVISSWLPEVRSLGNLDSPYFVKLITVTEFLSNLEEKVTVLVYDFMPNGSLKDCLIKKDSPCPLTWRLREKIALFAAEGLLYLYERKMIYGDFKASNILLNKYFTPQLAFFGLSRSREVAQSSIVSQPDHLAAESDIHMFGLVLYELLSGWSSANTLTQEDDVLKMPKMLPKEGDGFYERLENEFPKEAARKLARLADICLTENPMELPKMSHVFKILQQVNAQSKGKAHVSIECYGEEQPNQ